MHFQTTRLITSLVMIIILFLLASCGEQKSSELVGSFSEGVIITDESVDTVTELVTSAKQSSGNGSDHSIEMQTNHNDKSINNPELQLPEVSKEAKSPEPIPIILPSSMPTEQVVKPLQEQPSTSTPLTTNNQSHNNLEVIQTSIPNIDSIKPTTEPQDKIKKSKYQSISWNGFFDNKEQDTPSNEFWDLSEANTTVQIKGFMGEILSLDKNWFLLIPEPGAECPFDNGDETYWNKIMIVYVENGTKLRYTSKPLQITGRLDVGIKVDESGYKTMFRLYDAKFEEIKE